MQHLLNKVEDTFLKGYIRLQTAFRSKLTENKGDGGQAVGWIVGIAVVLLVATALFMFKDKIVSFIGDATDYVDGTKNDNFKLS